jgi:hypothetical protein
VVKVSPTKPFSQKLGNFFFSKNRDILAEENFNILQNFTPQKKKNTALVLVPQVLPMGFTAIVKHNKANTIMNLKIP